MKPALTILLVVCLTKLAQGSGTFADCARILEPLSVIECADFVSAPISLDHRQGQFYILDPMEQVVWTIAEAASTRDDTGSSSRARQAIELPTPTAHDLFFGCGDVLHLVDPMERALFVRESSGHGWTRLPLGYRVFFGSGDQRGILFNADRRHDEHLVTEIACMGDTIHLGAKLTHRHSYPSVANNMNYARLALSPDLLVVGHIALGRLQIHDRGGARLAEVSLAGSEVQEMRRVYLASQGRVESGILAVDQDTLITDLVRAARPDRFPVPVYINDLSIHAGLIWVLSNNTLLVYDRQGDQVASHAIGGQVRGEKVFIHDFCITEEGLMYGFDAAHYHKIYGFGPATMMIPADSGQGNEEGTAQ